MKIEQNILKCQSQNYLTHRSQMLKVICEFYLRIRKNPNIQRENDFTQNIIKLCEIALEF